MKEQIYTIPVNDAYDTQEECPLCFLEKKLEAEGIQYALGAAMMEPDYRVASNEKGYCNKHFSQMHAQSNKLSLALLLDTHLEEIRKKLSSFEKKSEQAASGKTGLFKKSNTEPLIEELCSSLHTISSGCMVCEKIQHTMERYMDVLLYMWSKDEAFREKFHRSKGLCLPHFEALCKMCKKSLNEKDAAQFLKILCKKQIEEFARIQADIHKFTLKFDYRNQDMEWGTAQDAPLRTIEKIAGKISKNIEP